MSNNGSFNPNDHIIQLKSKAGSQDYLPVQWRLVWFREACPQGTIETEMIHLDMDRECEEEAYVWNNDKKKSEKVIKSARGIAVFHAIARDDKGGLAHGTKSEKAVSFPDYIEKAETGAVGRALAALGYGTQFVAGEFDEGHRIVDAPVDMPQNGQIMPSVPPQTVAEALSDAPASPQQLASISKLCTHLGKDVPEVSTYEQAKEALAQLSLEYRNSRKAS